jgi:hypothetical protein
MAGETPHRDVIVQTMGRVVVDLKDKTDPASLRARARGRLALASELGRTGPEDALTRSSSVSALLKLGEPEMLELVKTRMLDEYDPLVKRAFEKGRSETYQ